MNHGVKMRIKGREVIHALGGLVGLLLLPLPVSPGDLCYDGRHAALISLVGAGRGNQVNIYKLFFL